MTKKRASAGRRAEGTCLVLPWVLFVAGCAADIDKQQPPPQAVHAVFEPAFSLLPTPNDLARNSQTGLLAVPVADRVTQPAQAHFDAYLNSLDGFPVSSSVSFCLSGMVDAATLDGAVKAIALPTEVNGAPTDVSDQLAVGEPTQSAACQVVTEQPCDPTAETSGCGDEQRCLPASTNVATLGVCADQGYRVVVTSKEAWKRDTTYVLLLSNAVKDADGVAVIRSGNFELAAGERPLCAVNRDDDTCTYNYSVPLAGSVEDQVRAELAAQGADLTEKQIDDAIHAETLSTATRFEQLRQATGQLLQAGAAAGLQRDDVVLAWAFSTTSQVEVVFDPANGLIPGPANDLIMADGKVNLPASAEETAEETALRLGLNTLDGFSTTGKLYTGVVGPLNPNTVKAGTELALIKVPEKGLPSLVEPLPVFAYDAANGLITLLPSAPLEEKTRYMVVLLSKRETQQITGPDGEAVDALSIESGGGLADEEGRRVIPSAVFALVRGSGPLVDDAGNATVSVLSNEQAAALEPIRQAYDQILTGLELAQVGKREDVVLLWTFQTQTISEPLVALRAGVYGTLLAVENAGGDGEPVPKPLIVNDPSKNFPPELCHPDCWPTPAPPEAIELFVAGAGFSSWNALDTSSDLLSRDLSGKSETVPLWLTLPKPRPCGEGGTCPTGMSCTGEELPVCRPDNGWPVVVFQHGLGASRIQFFAVADTLAKFGFAAAAFDIIYHGDRSACSDDAQCENPVEGGPEAKCDAELPRRCCVGEGEAKTCSAALLKKDSNGIPLASAAKFLNVANPFALKSNILQHVIDSVALLRALRFDGEAGLRAGDGSPLGVTLDATQVHFAGHSLGAMLGILPMSVDPLNQGDGPKRVYLNVPGAPMVQIFQETANVDFQQTVGKALEAAGATPGSREALQLFYALQWIVDPVDPANWARYLTQEQLPDPLTGEPVPKKVLLMQVGTNDQTIPGPRQVSLANWLGANVGKSTYDTTNHIFLLRPASDDPADALLQAAAQVQMGTFLARGAVCTPDLDDAANPCKVEGSAQ